MIKGQIWEHVNYHVNIHELCPVQLLEVTKFEDIPSGLICPRLQFCIQPLAYIYNFCPDALYQLLKMSQQLHNLLLIQLLPTLRVTAEWPRDSRPGFSTGLSPRSMCIHGWSTWLVHSIAGVLIPSYKMLVAPILPRIKSTIHIHTTHN